MSHIPSAWIEFERWQKATSDWLALPAVEQTQAELRNLVSSRTNHAGDVQHSDTAFGSGSTTSSAMDNGYISLMADPNGHNSSALQNIFDAEWALYAPASTSVNDRADTIFNLITNEPGRYYIGGLPMNTALARVAASTSIPQ